MPDIVSPRPVSGDPIATAWGTEVHDAIEGMQYGMEEVSISGASNATVLITFPRPYISAPVIFVTVGEGNAYGWIGAYTDNKSSNGITFKLIVFHRAATSTTTTVTVSWLAIGTLAP